jgi:predicted GH43/DUF377 family glycosyl hydrolase
MKSYKFKCIKDMCIRTTVCFYSIIACTSLFSFSQYPKKFNAIKHKNQIKVESRSTLSFSDFSKTFNPSIVTVDGVQRLFVRIEGNDVKHVKTSHFYDSYIGVSKYEGGDNWGNIQLIDLQSNYVEDPRAVVMNDKIFLFFNDVVNSNSHYRIMKIAVLNLDCSVEKIFPVDFQHSLYEKNWVPFVVNNSSDELYFIYGFSPLKIYKAQYENAELIVTPVIQHHDAFYTDLGFWESEWGIIRGGTPLCQIGDSSFIGLFHSSYYSRIEKKRWYIFGSYILTMRDGSFYLDKISKSPILFKNMYSPIFSPTADRKKRVLFPGGLTLNGNSLNVFFGINDSYIERVEFRLPQVMKSMKNLEL